MRDDEGYVRAEIVSGNADKIEGKTRQNEARDGRSGRGERKSKIDGGGQRMRRSKTKMSSSTQAKLREHTEVSGHLGSMKTWGAVWLQVGVSAKKQIYDSR